MQWILTKHCSVTRQPLFHGVDLVQQSSSWEEGQGLIFPKHVMPKWDHIHYFKALDQQYKQSQKDNYNRQHRVRSLPELPANQPVWVNGRGQQIPGQILQSASTPRSYLVKTKSGQLRRN